jgi:hypothetical protein
MHLVTLKMYIKVDLSTNFLSDIQKLVSILENSNIDFIGQLRPEAGLGCHPYHITIAGNINNCFKNQDELDNFLLRWRHDNDVITITPTGRYKITKTGKIIMLVNSPYLKQIGSEIINELPNNRKVNSYINSKYLHITIGITTNKFFFGKEFTSKFAFLNNTYYSSSFGWDY